MRKISYVMLLAIVAISACQNQAFKKGKQGIEYKIISDGKGDKMKVGDFMQIHVGQYYATGKSDSSLSDTRTGSGPLIEIMDSATTPAAYYEILKELRNHDSLVLRILTDSAFSKSPENMPPFIKKGHYLTTTVKVLNVFKTRAAADSARDAELAITQKRDSIKSLETLAKDDKILQQYFTKNNIKTIKSPAGVYVEIIQPGTGNNIDTSVVVSVNYTGKTIEGKQFDSNTDGSKPGAEPLSVNMTNERSLGNRMINGWMDALPLLNKGAKAKFYIPSTLGYGARESELIPANSILIFDIEVLEIYSKDQAKEMIKTKMASYKLKQKAYMDSAAKSNGQTEKSTQK